MKHRKALLAIIGVVVIAVVGWLIYRANVPPREEIIKIGAVLPLTGPASEIGSWQKQGIDLALQEVNMRGGIAGKKVVVIYEDSKGDPKEGTLAFTRLIADRDIHCVFSSLSSVSSAILPIAHDHRIVLVMLAVSLPGIADRSEWAFRFNVGSDDEAMAMAKFLATRMQRPAVAVYYVNDEFGNGASVTFRKIYGGYGGQVVRMQAYGREQTDHRSNLIEITGSNVRGVYVIGYTKAAVLAIRQVREMGISIPVFANMALSVPVFLELGGEALEGVYFTTSLFNPDAKEATVVRFVEQYRERFGSNPNFFSAFSYDAFGIVAEAIRKGSNTSVGIKEALLSIVDYPGVMGKISVAPNGDAKFPVRVVKLAGGRIVEVE